MRVVSPEAMVIAVIVSTLNVTAVAWIVPMIVILAVVVAMTIELPILGRFVSLGILEMAAQMCWFGYTVGIV